MSAKIKYAYQKTLDLIVAHCNKVGVDDFYAPDLELPHGHTRALSTRGKIRRVSRGDAGTKWKLVRSACV